MGKYHIGDHVRLGGIQSGVIESIIEIVGDRYYPNGLYSIRTLDNNTIYAEEEFLDSLQNDTVENIGHIPVEDFQSIINENYN